MSESLSQPEQKELLKIARDTIVSHITTGKVAPVETSSSSLCSQSGCFVTIKQQGKLRGCIGNFVSEAPLYRLVQEMAISAATKDPRFYPMRQDDLEHFELDISVLSPLSKIESPDEIQVGQHGLYIIKDTYQGVLLPQVATEFGWDRDTFLKHTCLKAGLPDDAWQKDCEIYIFSAQVFGEK